MRVQSLLNPFSILVLLGTLTLASACGEVKAVFSSKDKSGTSDPAPIATPPAAAQPATPQVAAAAPATKVLAPLQTYLADGTVLPSHLKANSLLVSFRSNDATATFDCQPSVRQDWVPCNAGSGYDFGRLVHSRGYTVRVRARTADGRVDAQPILLSFYADLLAGSAPTLPGDANKSLAASVYIPASVNDLPVANAPAAAPRSLQIGAYYALNVPTTGVVNGYATDKTYNTTIHTMMRLPTGGSIWPSPASCTATYQRIITATDGTQYCDGTPNPGQMSGDGAVPRNFIEVALNPGSAAHEELLVAAIDGTAAADADPATARLSIASRCQGAVAGGQSPLPLLPQFYAGAQTQSLVWCHTKLVNGQSQWLGMVIAPLTADQTGPGLRVVYAIDASSQGLVSASQLIDRASQTLLRLLTPVAPLAPSA